MTKQCLCIYRLQLFQRPPSAFLWKLKLFWVLGVFLSMVCMFALVVIQSYIFIPTTDIYFLKFCSSKYCLSRSLLTFSRVLVRLATHLVRLLCHYLTLLVFVLNKVCLPLSPTDLGSLYPTDHTFYTPWQAIAPLPKNPFIVVFDRTFGDFVDINERVVLKSVLQLYMELLWMWIFWSLNHYCNDYYCHFYWSIPLMQWMPFFNTSQFIFFWGR